MKQTIPQQLKQLREARGLRLTDIANRLGKEKTHIRYIESENSNLTIRTITDYLAAMSLDFELTIINKK